MIKLSSEKDPVSDCFSLEAGFLDGVMELMQSPYKNFNLVVTDKFKQKKERPVISNIRKLNLDYFDKSWLYWFRSCSFPSLNELCLKGEIDPEREDGSHKKVVRKFSDRLNDIFSGMQNLKHLYLRIEEPNYHHGKNIDEKAPFQLDSADVNYMFSFLREGYYDKVSELKSLKISKTIHYYELEEIFGLHKKLEKFTAKIKGGDSRLITVNKSITTMDINITNMEMLEPLMRSTPSLEVLYLRSFLTSPMINLIGKKRKSLEFCQLMS